LAACAAPSSSSSDHPAGDESDVTKAPAFGGSGAGTDVKLDGKAAKVIAPSTQIAALVKEMTDANTNQNNQFLAASYKAPPETLAAFSSSANGWLAQKNMGFDMMYRADGSAPGQNQGFGWAEKWNSEYESMSCRATSRDKADARFKRFGAYKSQQGDDQISAAARKKIERDATKLVASFLGGLGADAKIYSCHWDNNDDTDSDALILLDGGEARVIVAWAGG
jgi:hypothetical protein